MPAFSKRAVTQWQILDMSSLRYTTASSRSLERLSLSIKESFIVSGAVKISAQHKYTRERISLDCIFNYRGR